MVKVEIIATVKSAQSQNGLKHSDYLRSLRKSLKFFLGHGKFEKKEITPELSQDPRYILIILFNSERA